ncbi:MAG TPA: hypothetical protein VHX20_04790 [Terracidiphilus sp.]|jgi:hypothetical protein|nr:hypothetical protein [Terracidiphilus sp.]
MDIVHPDPVWLILPLLAVVFFLWVLWNFWQDERKQRRNDRAAQPKLLVSSGRRDGSLDRGLDRDLDRDRDRDRDLDGRRDGRRDRPDFGIASRDARAAGERVDAPMQRAARS